MDFILLLFLLIYLIKGYFQGFLQIVFSLFFTILNVYLAYKFSSIFADFLQNIQFLNFQQSITNVIDSVIGGRFNDIDELISTVGQSEFVFKNLLINLLSNISFEGDMSAGEVLAPIINLLVLRLLAFIILFLVFGITIGIIKTILYRMFDLFKMKTANHFLGGIVGLVKGILIFSIFYILLLSLANFTLNTKLLDFCFSGKIVNFIYSKINLLL